MTEKILAKASGKPEVSPGDNIWVIVDVLMIHDVSGPGAFGIFKKEFGQNAKVCPASRVLYHANSLCQEFNFAASTWKLILNFYGFYVSMARAYVVDQTHLFELYI